MNLAWLLKQQQLAITRKTEWSDTYQNIGNEVVNMATHVDSSSQIGYDWG